MYMENFTAGMDIEKVVDGDGSAITPIVALMSGAIS